MHRAGSIAPSARRGSGAASVAKVVTARKKKKATRSKKDPSLRFALYRPNFQTYLSLSSLKCLKDDSFEKHRRTHRYLLSRRAAQQRQVPVERDERGGGEDQK